jgi:hypothetical protein
MTGLLRDTMNERADAAGRPHLDLGAIIEDGDRRVRRRRVAASGAIAVAAAAVVAAVAFTPAALDSDSDRPPAVGAPDGPFARDLPTYAVGSQIHYGDDVLRLDHQVRSFVQTDAGFVYSAPEGQVMFTDGHDERQIGSTDSAGNALAADDSGPYVAWLDPTGPAGPEFVVYDTSRGEEAVRTADGIAADPQAQNDINTMAAVIAIDGGTVYWHDSIGVQAYDIASGAITTVQGGADANWLDDVESGVLAHQRDLHYRGDAGSQQIVVGADPDAGRGFAPFSHGYLSPDAQHVALFGGDQTEIHNVATGADVSKAMKARSFSGAVYFGQWIDDDQVTFVVHHETQSGLTTDLFSCSIAAQACEVAASDISGEGQDPAILPGMPAG